jgi:hypothetical protein
LPELTKNDGKKALSRSIIIKILIFTGLVGLSAAAMRPVQSALHAAMKHIRVNFISRIETATGMQIRYSSIRPTIFGSFDIRNLQLIKNENAFLSISRIRISFSLLELLRGKKAAVHSIQLDRPSVNIDWEKDREVFEFFSSLKKKDKNLDDDSEILEKIAEYFPGKPDFRIRNCFFVLTGGGKTYQIHDMNVDITGDGEKLFLAGSLDAEFKYANFFNKTFNVKTGIGINGECTVDFEEGAAQIVFSSLSSTLFDLRPVSIGAVFKDSVLNLRLLGENTSGGAHFDYNTETGGISAALNCRRFLLSDFVSFSDALKDADSLLSTAVTGGAFFEYEPGGVMRYNADLRGGDLFAVNARGNEKSVVVNEFRLHAPAKAAFFHGDLGFSGRTGFSPLTPSGTIYFDCFSLTGKEDFTAVFNVSNRNREIQISAEKAVMGQTVLDNVDIFMLPSAGDLGVLVSAFCENRASVNMEAALNYAPRQLEASLAINSLSIADIADILGPFANNLRVPAAGKGYMRNTLINAEFFFSTDFEYIMYNAPNVLIETGGMNGMLSFSGTNNQFILSEGIFKSEDRDFLVSARVNFSNPADLAFSFNASYLDFSWQVEGQILDRATLIIRDPNGLHVYGSASNSGALSGYLEGIDFPVPLNGKMVYLNFYITLRYTSQDFWSVDVARLMARDFNSPDGRDFLMVSGVVDHEGASFRNILYTDYAGDLAGGVDFSWDSDFSYIQFLINLTDGREDGEFYLMEGMLRDGRFNVAGTVNDMRLDRFFGWKSTAIVNGDISLSWESLESFNARINLDSLRVKTREIEILASAAVNFNNDEIIVRNLAFDYTGVRAVLPVLQISRAENFAKASADIKGIVLQKRFEGKVELDADFQHIGSWVDIGQALSSINGSIRTENILYGDDEQEPFDFKFARNRGELSVSGGPGNMIRLEMDNEGNFFTSLSAPLPIRSTVSGKFRNGIIDAHCADLFMDLPAFWAMMPPVSGFTIDGGYVTAKVDIRGPIINPQFFGTGRGSSLRIQVPDYVGRDIRPVPFNVNFEGNEMTFSQVETVVGGGGGLVNGWFRFENWVPGNLGLEISIPQETPVPYKLNITGFLATGDASGNLFLTLDNSIMEIKGELYANNAELGLSIDDIIQGRAESDSFYDSGVSAVVNMTVTTGSMVEFIWPNTGMPILRANLEMGTVLVVSADTLSRQYSLNSDVKIRGGEVNYFDRSFYIRQGNLVFRENELQFAPRLNARAEIRDRTDSGPVTISMIIENEPLLNFVPRFEASPVLTQLEIYSLLGQSFYGIGGSESADSAQRIILTSTTDLLTQIVANNDILSQFVNLRQFERQIRNLLRLDMFSVRTRILQNAVVSGAAGLGQGQPPVDRNNRVGNYFDNTTVFIGKYIGQDMFVQGMLSMRYDENNMALGGLRFEPDFGIELQSPFFNIRWDFFPYHPENWWVNDNSITLTWSRSF